MSVMIMRNEQKLTLYEMRQASGKSGAAVCRLCGISYRTLRNWEAGINIPNVVNIQDLLQIYGYTFYELDLTPFHSTYHERTLKHKQSDDHADNPNRDRRQFERDLCTQLRHEP